MKIWANQLTFCGCIYFLCPAHYYVKRSDFFLLDLVLSVLNRNGKKMLCIYLNAFYGHSCHIFVYYVTDFCQILFVFICKLFSVTASVVLTIKESQTGLVLWAVNRVLSSFFIAIEEHKTGIAQVAWLLEHFVHRWRNMDQSFLPMWIEIQNKCVICFIKWQCLFSKQTFHLTFMYPL